MLLVHFLREECHLTGAHIGCETSHCGACTVDLDGKSVKSCTMFAIQANGAEILTIEGMAGADGSLHVLQDMFREHHGLQCGFCTPGMITRAYRLLQEMFREHHGLQCGFCTPGMITRAYRLLQENPNPNDTEIRAGIAGNLCRCTGYQNIVKAIRAAADQLSGKKEAAE